METDMRYKIMFVILIIMLFAGGVFLGMKLTPLKNESVTTISSDEENLVYNEDNELVDTITKKYDIELVYEDNYTLCGETVTKKETIYDTTLDELKEVEESKQESEGKVYRIKLENNEKLVYTRNISENCPNHFIAILEDNVINVYRNIDEDNKTLYKKLETQDKLIRDDIKDELTNGILLDSYEELNLFIEDLES